MATEGVIRTRRAKKSGESGTQGKNQPPEEISAHLMSLPDFLSSRLARLYFPPVFKPANFMPLLKETRDSLRIFFAFAAALSLRPAGAEIDYGNSSALALVPRFVETTFAVMFLYIAIRFEKLLPKPTLIKGVLVVSMVLSVCNFAVSLRSGVQVSSIVGLILSLLLSVYLLKSVTRLSKEVASRTA